MIKEYESIMGQATGGERWSWKTYMTIVGLCQMGHNNFSVSFCSHSSRVYKRTQVCYTTTDMERHSLSEHRTIFTFLPCKHYWSATRVVSRHFQKSGKLTPNSVKKALIRIIQVRSGETIHLSMCRLRVLEITSRCQYLYF